jgi:hypothetical protein
MLLKKRPWELSQGVLLWRWPVWVKLRDGEEGVPVPSISSLVLLDIIHGYTKLDIPLLLISESLVNVDLFFRDGVHSKVQVSQLPFYT